jgi:hypothetical protein
VGFIGNNGSNLIAQEQIFAKVLKTEYRGLKYAGHVLYGGAIPDAVSQVQAFIGANSGLDLLFWADGSGNAVAQELVQIGGKIKWLIGGFGKPGLAALKRYPQVVGLIDRNPFDEEFYGFQPLFWWTAGYRVPDTILVSTYVIDKATVAKYIKDPYRR